MALALALARQAAERGEVPVGAVITDATSGAVIASGANAPIALCDPTAHAEIVALRAAAKILRNYRLHGLVLHVTLEPCAMCAGAISLSRIARVVFAAPDPKGGALVHGPRFFDQPTCHWRPEILHDTTRAEDAATLLRNFFRQRRNRNPGDTPE
jgi:tRNA(Arg) A34 adenosine deaminase TadA